MGTSTLTRISPKMLLIFVFYLLLQSEIQAWSGWNRILHNHFTNQMIRGLAIAQAVVPIAAVHAIAVQYKLPPIDLKNEHRCELVSSSMGQANAARDKLYDLRLCSLKGQTAEGKDLSGMIGSDADFTGVSFKDAQISKAYVKSSKFIDCDFTNVVADRVIFDESDLTNAVFKNAVLSGASFQNSNLKNTDFSDSYLGPFDSKNLCANPSLEGSNPVTGVNTKESAGCI